MPGGLAQLDEVTAWATSGELDHWHSGFIYCSVINACVERSDWKRAADWTDRADRWCARESVGFFPGICLVHRATIMRQRGELREAESHTLRGGELVRASSPIYSAQVYRELAEIRYRLGDLSGAEEACRRCVEEIGLELQPHLAMIRFERGDAVGAIASLDRALADPLAWHRNARLHILPAKITICLAVDRDDEAEGLLVELDALARELGSPAALAQAACARGEVDLHAGRHAAAITALRRALAGWIEDRAPFEAACVRGRLAAALAAAGDREAATLELDVALATFERMGAALEAERIRSRLDVIARWRTN